MSTIRFCIRILFRASRSYALAILSSAVFLSLVPFLALYISGRLVQFLSENIGNPFVTYRELFLILLSLLLINLVGKAIEYLRTYLNGLLNELVDKETDLLLMDKATALDMAHFDSSAFYNEIKDATLNKYYLQSTTFSLIDLVKTLIQLCVAILSLARISWLGSVLLALSTVPNVLFLKKQYQALYDLQRENLALDRKKAYLAEMTQDKSFAKEIKLYRLGSFLLRKYLFFWKMLYDKKQRTTRKYTLLLTLSSALPELVSLGVLFTLCRGIFQGSLQLGDFVYYQGVALQVLAAMLSAILILGQINDGSNRVRNFIKFLHWENQVPDDGDRVLAHPRKIEFKNVSFRYSETQEVLKNVNLTLHTGQLTALVGSNGCGKSTLIKLLLRFYDPTAGEITVDGVDIRRYTLKSLRAYFSILFQDYGRYAFTVGESTGLSDLEQAADEGKIADSLRAGGAYPFVQRFPQGVRTFLTRQFDEDGVELSTGQWQSLALSRAFFREGAGMFIFDEPSSALDAEAEAALFQRLEALYRRKGGIVVSHRLSNLISADMIYVLEDGAVIEKGTHRALLEQNGKYAHMFRLQAEKYGVRCD